MYSLEDRMKVHTGSILLRFRFLRTFVLFPYSVSHVFYQAIMFNTVGRPSRTPKVRSIGFIRKRYSQ